MLPKSVLNTNNYNMPESNEKSMSSDVKVETKAELGGKKPPTRTPVASKEEINALRDTVLKGFIAEHGIPPSQVRQVIRKNDDGSESWEIVKKDSTQNQVYIAGPITGISDNNVHAFLGAGKLLNDQGYIVFNPIHTGDGNMGLPYKFYLRHALKMLAECDYMYLLPGWENSKGASMEVYVAWCLGLNFLTNVKLVEIITALNRNWFKIDLELKVENDTNPEATPNPEGGTTPQAEGESNSAEEPQSSPTTDSTPSDPPE